MVKNLLRELAAIIHDAESLRELLGALWVLATKRPLEADAQYSSK